MEEIYKIKLNTPMGLEEGTLTLLVNEGSVSGVIKSKRGNSKFNNGSYKNGELAFKGILKVAIMSFSYEASCKVSNGDLKGVVTTKYGPLNFEGTKI